MSWDDGDYYAASFGVHKCRRYHALLRDFYRGSHRVIVAANIVASSGAFIAFLSSAPAIAGPLSAVVAVASLYDYIFSAEKAATLHHELCCRFTKLAASLETLKATPEILKTIRAERLVIEADEPSLKRLVDLMAYRDEARSRGVEEAELMPLTWWQRRLGYFFTFGMRGIEEWKATREREATRGAA